MGQTISRMIFNRNNLDIMVSQGIRRSLHFLYLNKLIDQRSALSMADLREHRLSNFHLFSLVRRVISVLHFVDSLHSFA